MKKSGIEPPVSKDARFELRARRGPSRVPGSGVGFRFVFPFFFLSITLALAIGPLSRSCLVPLSFPLRGFGLLVSVHLFAHLLLSFLTAFSLIPSSGPTLRRLWAPRAPERRSSYHQERGGSNLT